MESGILNLDIFAQNLLKMKEILEFIEVKYNSIFESIEKEKQLSDSTTEDIRKAAEEFKSVFKTNA